LNKIQKSQEDHENYIKNDIKDLNLNESSNLSISNILKENLSSSVKFESEADLENVIIKFRD
jgi:hypothetical protein